METIKNILKPGGNADDEILYGSGKSTNPAHTGNTGTLSGEGSHLSTAQATGPTSGEGSHFSSARDNTTTGAGTTNVGNTSTTTGPHSSNLLNKVDPRVDSNPAGNTNSGYGSAGHSSMPGGFPDESETPNPYSSKAMDPRLGESTQTTSGGLGSTGNTHTAPQSGLTGQNTTGNDHHYARDGAAVGGAAAVGSGIHNHRENERAVEPQTSSTISHPGGSTNTNTTTTTTSTTGPHNSNLLNKLDPRVKNDQSSATANTGATDHHYGRDATALGGAAAVGEGIHHHREGERENLASNSGYTGTTPYGAGQPYHGGPAGTAISGPHSTDTANRLDPNVNTSGGRIDDVHQHHTQTGGGAEQADLAHGESKHHYGRDAAGVGAAGLGAHELKKHHDEKKIEKESYPSTTTHANAPTNVSSTQAARDQEHQYGRDAAGVGATGLGAHEVSKHHNEPARTTDLGHTTGATQAHTGDGKDHHYGRDAAGVGAAGVGAHELSKHHEKELAAGSSAPRTGAATDTDPILVGPVHKSSLLNKLDPRVKEVSRENASAVGSGTLPHDSASASKDHHYGRDAAGVGAVGLGAHEVKKHHDEKELDGSTGLSEHEKLKREVALNQKGNHYGQDMPGYTAGTTGAPGTIGAQDTHQYHHGRDAVGAGAVGAGAYEAEKHHKHDKDLNTEHRHEASDEKKSGGLLGFLHRDKNKQYTKEEEDAFERQEREHNSHKGRDTALGAGAAGVGAHELHKHHKESEAEKQQGYSSVPGQTNTDSHLGRDVAGAGAVGTGAYEAEKHHHGHSHTDSDTMKPLPTAPGNHGVGTGEGTQNALVMERKRGEGYGDPLGDHLHGAARNRGVDDATGNIAGTHQPAGDNLITGSGNHSHLGRDAAIGAGAGGVGVGAYEHEHNKHTAAPGTASTTYPTNENYTTGTGPSNYDNTTQGYGSTGLTGASVPRDSSLGAGAGGLGHTVSTSGGHNKLHKNPPASHPAAQAGLTSSEGAGPTGTHVPASGAQREQMIGQGIQGDTGVAHPHTDMSKNY